MKKSICLLFAFVICSCIALAQPANNNCATAQSLGTLATPAPCPGTGQGNITAVAGTIVGATPGNPYIFQNNCSGAGGPNMGVPANDVWYSFVASGYQCVISINSTFANPNVALYAGNCNTLGGGVGGCAVGTGGAVTLTVEQMVIGTTYYIQVSGNVGQTGTFNMTVKNNRDCADCLLGSTFTATPPPINGMYQPGQTVQFCYHITNYAQINANWLHGVQVSLGSGWNTATIVATPPPPCQINPVGGSWLWLNGCTSTANGTVWGQGFYFDTTDPGTNPGNNFGDNCTGNITAANWNFCFTVTTKVACIPGSNLSVTINTSGDGESGSWTSLGCLDDPASTFNAIGACCPPIMSSVAVTCIGNNGQATSTPVGSAGPFDYVWTGPAGYTNNFLNLVGASTITGLAPGVYTVVTTDVNNCPQTTTVTVAGVAGVGVPTAVNTGPYCAGATIALTGTGGGTYSWAGPSGFTSIAQNPTIAASTTLMSGIYSLTVTVNGCTATATTNVVVNALPIATATNTGPYCAGATIALTGTGGGTYSWVGPSGFTSIAQNPTIAASTTLMSGIYSLTVTTNGCTSTATTNVVVNALPIATATNTGPYCEGATIALTGTGGGTYSWVGPSGFTSIAQNPTIAASTTLMSGIYSLTVTVNGCTATATTNVVVNPSLNPIIASSTPICEGTDINLFCLNGNTWTWLGPNGFTSTAQNPSILAATPLESGNYSITAVDLAGCIGTATLTVLVNPSPVPTASNIGTYCQGTTITLSSTGGGTYSWSGPAGFTSSNQNNTIAASTVAMSGIYTVTVSLSTCTAVASTTVLVEPVPIATATNTGPYCLGSTTSISATGGGTYSWSGPAGFTSINQNLNLGSSTLAMNGVYTVLVTLSTCTASATTTVIVNPLPVPIPLNNSPVCLNQVINISSNNGFINYGWSGPNGFISLVQNPTIASASLSNAGVYTLIVVDANGCIDSANTTVVVNPLPVIVANNNGPLCPTSTLNLTSIAGLASYSWVGPNLFISNLENPTIPNVTIAEGGVYTVTVTDVNGCISNASTTLIINGNIVITAASNSPICLNAPINLSANGGTTFSWTGPNGFSSLSQNPIINSASLLMSGTYSVTGIDANGCTGDTTVTIVVNQLPVAIANNNGPQCDGSNLNLTSNGGLSYSWVGPGLFSSSLQNPTIISASAAASGIYTVTVTSAATCTSTATTTVTINPIPVPVINSNSPVCNNSSINLTAAGGISYSWSGPNAFTSAIQNATITNATTAMSGIYTLTVTGVGGCTATATVTVTVLPAVSIVANQNIIICSGSNVNLTSVASGGNGNYTYMWTPINVPLANTTTTPTVTTTYTITVTSCGQTSTDNVLVTVNPIPALTITPNITSGCAPICVTFTGTSIPASATCNWIFSNGVSSSNNCNPIICFANAGQYGADLSVVDINGCANTLNAANIISVFPVPVAAFSFSPTTATIFDPVINFIDLTAGATISNWAWTFGDPLNSTSTQQNPTFTYQSNGTYLIQLIVTSINGCIDNTSNTIIIEPAFSLYVPNAFSPNEDGINDDFFAKGEGIDTDHWDLWIYDRWGNMIFYTNEFNRHWDGKVSGASNEVQEDVYVWKIKYRKVSGESKSIIGHVSVVR